MEHCGAYNLQLRAKEMRLPRSDFTFKEVSLLALIEMSLN